MAEQTETFAEHRTDILARAEAAGWPEVCAAGVGLVAGESGWIVAIETASPHELIVLAGALAERDDLNGEFDDAR